MQELFIITDYGRSRGLLNKTKAIRGNDARYDELSHRADRRGIKRTCNLRAFELTVLGVILHSELLVESRSSDREIELKLSSVGTMLFFFFFCFVFDAIKEEFFFSFSFFVSLLTVRDRGYDSRK